ncbi:hypothetical protein HPB52_012203 [Rhipicephalus sanguineus]|uniref:Uncharacterized protein n=1 Tax=Rhipicephalus sanguineus TaxID=34632 RepID=A0A9D4SWL4_RHISA|nr:hypothetical protein HPB52_012203 [Rhipicephalus sanguineus]
MALIHCSRKECFSDRSRRHRPRVHGHRMPLPSCDPSVTSINAASVDAYNFAPRPMVPSPAVNAHLGYEGHDGFVRGPSAVSQTWDGRAIAPFASNVASAATSPDFVLSDAACQPHQLSDHALSIGATITLGHEKEDDTRSATSNNKPQQPTLTSRPRAPQNECRYCSAAGFPRQFHWHNECPRRGNVSAIETRPGNEESDPEFH